MRVEKIHIRNLKGIQDLSVDFNYGDLKNIFTIHGKNGAGKTTLLEAISLVGHITSMSRIAVADNNAVSVQSSILREGINASKKGLVPTAEFDSKAWEPTKESLGNGIDAWWEARSRNNVSTPHNSGSAALMCKLSLDGEKLTFWISFLQAPDNSITTLLSSDYDDLNLENYFALLYRSRDASLIHKLLSHFLVMCPHEVTVKEGQDGKKRNSVIQRGELELTGSEVDKKLDKSKVGEENVEISGIMSYLNTDLNTFGRKNDIRESVKNIRSEFSPVVEGRLGLNIGIGKGADTPAHGTKLEIVSRAVHNLSDLRIKRLYSEIDSQTGETQTYLWIARGDSEEEHTIHYLSAGENEAFTFFFFFQWMPIKNSVLLLDEPDLHISATGKIVLFEEIFKMAEANKCQLIISTHSSFVTSDGQFEAVQPLLLRREKNNEGASHICDWSNDAAREVRKELFYISWLALKNTGVREFVATLSTYVSKWIGIKLPESALGWWVYFIAFLLFFALFPFFLLKLLLYVSPNWTYSILDVVTMIFIGAFVILLFIEAYWILTKFIRNNSKN